uniref:Uncharacterized protein n=1 Tax=viral metagenome TaxID=1070528 RepID=A0A6M3LCJ3_9ZZZZ
MITFCESCKHEKNLAANDPCRKCRYVWGKLYPEDNFEALTEQVFSVSNLIKE